jgi:hypothetical protein
MDHFGLAAIEVRIWRRRESKRDLDGKEAFEVIGPSLDCSDKLDGDRRRTAKNGCPTMASEKIWQERGTPSPWFLISVDYEDG